MSTLHAGRTARGGNEGSAFGRDQDRAPLALGEAKPLAVEFGTKRRVSFRKGCPDGGAVETRRNTLRPFTRGVGKSLCPVTSSFGARRLDGFAVVLLVAPGEVFKTPIVLPAIEHPQRHGIDLGNSDMEMGAAVFHMAHDQARAVGSDLEFRIDGSKKPRQLRRRHLPFWGNRQMADAVSTIFCGGERLSVMEGIPIARQNFDPFIFIGFVEQVMSEIVHAAGAVDACRLDDHWMISRRRPRSASSSASAFASSGS